MKLSELQQNIESEIKNITPNLESIKGFKVFCDYTQNIVLLRLEVCSTIAICKSEIKNSDVSMLVKDRLRESLISMLNIINSDLATLEE